MRSSNQNYRDKIIVILKKSIYRMRNIYGRMLREIFSEDIKPEVNLEELQKKLPEKLIKKGFI